MGTYELHLSNCLKIKEKYTSTNMFASANKFNALVDIVVT